MWDDAGQATDPLPVEIGSLLAEIPGMHSAAALARLGGRANLLVDLLYDFRDAFRATPQRLAQAWEQGDRLAAAVLAHSLIGPCGALGLDEVVHAARSLEKTLRAVQDAPEAAGLAPGARPPPEMDHLLALLGPALAALERLPAAGGPSPLLLEIETAAAPDFDHQAVEQALLELDTQMRRCSLKARKQFEVVRPLLVGLAAPSDLAEVETCLNRLDFKGGRAALARLAQQLGMEIGDGN